MQRGQALKSGQLEAKGVEILTKARQAKRKNEAAKSNAELRKKRAQEALRVVGEIRVKESPAGEPKLICSVLMEAWKKDPSMKGYFERKECTCVTANRPPVCGDKGMKYPEPEEKASGFYYVFSYLTDGHAMVREGNCFRTNKVYDEALEQCKEEVKGLLDPTEHFISPPIFIPW